MHAKLFLNLLFMLDGARKVAITVAHDSSLQTLQPPRTDWALHCTRKEGSHAKPMLSALHACMRAHIGKARAVTRVFFSGCMKPMWSWTHTPDIFVAHKVTEAVPF